MKKEVRTTQSLDMTLMVNSPSGLTMSSLDIANLTGKEHRNVNADIRNMMNKLDLTAANFSAAVPYDVNNGATRTREVFNLPKDLTMTLVTGYNIPLRHSVVKRWDELESQSLMVQPPETFNMVTAPDSRLSHQLNAVEYADNVFKRIPEISKGNAANIKAKLASGTIDISDVKFEDLLGKKTLVSRKQVLSKVSTKATFYVQPVAGKVVVSELARRVNTSPQMMNIILTDNGYQKRVKRIGNSGYDYTPTKLGEKYASSPSFFRNGKESTMNRQYLYWSPTILEEFKQLEEQ